MYALCDVKYIDGSLSDVRFFVRVDSHSFTNPKFTIMCEYLTMRSAVVNYFSVSI